jgi:hypothetical protein
MSIPGQVSLKSSALSTGCTLTIIGTDSGHVAVGTRGPQNLPQLQRDKVVADGLPHYV